MLSVHRYRPVNTDGSTGKGWRERIQSSVVTAAKPHPCVCVCGQVCDGGHSLPTHDLPRLIQQL